MAFPKDWLFMLARTGHLPAPRLEQALELAEVTPSPAQTQRFVDRLLAVVAVLLIASGVICFFAFNWADMPRGIKFGLVLIGLTLSVALAHWKGLEQTSGKAALAMACVLTGVLFAVAGQIYQTGADPFMLFVAWAVLILPWVIQARSGSLWLFWLALANLAGHLYLMQDLDGWWDWLTPGFAFWIAAAANGVALALWEALASPKAARWQPRFLCWMVLGYATSLMMQYIIDYRSSESTVFPVATLGYLLTVGLMSGYYLRARRDLFPLAGLCVSGMVVLIALYLKNIDKWDNAGAFLLLAILICGMTSAAAIGLRRLQLSWEQHDAR